MDSTDFQTIVFDSPLLRIGLFRCRPWYAQFEDTGPTDGYLIVFPRTSVSITHAGSRPIVADPNVVMFYNKRQIYTRRKLSDGGDLCEWFAFAPHTIVDAIRPYDPQVVERGERPFALTHGPSDPRSYLLQRIVVDHLLCAERPDQLYVEEIMLSVLAQVIENAYQVRGATSPRSASGSSVELAEAIKALLATCFREQLSLDRIARAAYTSPYHLCRIFRKQTGSTIHRYLNQIRLRTALEDVMQGNIDLTTLGLDLGYSSHSHFTQAFRQTFGTSPSGLRRVASARRLHELSKILIA